MLCETLVGSIYFNDLGDTLLLLEFVGPCIHKSLFDVYVTCEARHKCDCHYVMGPEAAKRPIIV